MTSMTRAAVTALVVAMGSPFQTAAQRNAPASAPRVVPTLGVHAVPGFRYRAPGLGAGGAIRLDSEHPVPPFNTITIESDARGRCSHSAHMPARDAPAEGRTASAIWRVEAAPVAIDGDEVTVDVRWSRRVLRPGAFFESDTDRHERLTLRDGAQGILDVVRATADVPGVCESFAIALDLRFGSTDDEEDAGLGFDLWLIDRSELSRAPLRVRTQGRQGADVAYSFPPIGLKGEAGPLTLSMNGVVRGRARHDGTIDLTFDTTQVVHDDSGSRSGGGRKRLLVRPGDTIEFELPAAEKARLPLELQRHDFVMRVTTERLW